MRYKNLFTKTKIKMVTNNLQACFDKNRDPHLERLDFLKSLWINPSFAEKCALMFEQIWATIEEIRLQEENIVSINSNLEESIYNTELKRQRLHRKSALDYSL